ncbi:hypothetical protein BD309DRAFT_947142 [Dichomitus squalens]|uniref:Uncharacterized protein n=2 Tax=Dichomitus squalens TaxID=114155 RepID=A0A4Q9PWV2_9APHY|nr:uncharacterized protein DICSQDRAFT_161686 [Dichomitus squalens LYAD-421 SS1]EJF61260.1 hypothetical protein DICSQDRAFT_161686 [Dichomitus squalens LYAD-421 SS1]TBU32738.1 hypothetical protein BD311DRAFT_749639 [Dichomitus squalens]TBU49567.1 hypothetical protein BD309DRAFT_947142 [Dichomitus squalens]TBU59101.1 hypothetical protein BD310DRAFT_925684 [Dichomitus squalens]
MDRFLAPQSPEAQAHTYLTENWFSWDQDHPSLDETLTSGCATYQAFQRFLNGADLYLVPQNRSDLESVLRRYAYDAIHNTIAKSRSQLERGGYSRMCHLVEESIRKVLNENDNAATLLDLHRPRHESRMNDFSASGRSIRIK